MATLQGKGTRFVTGLTNIEGECGTCGKNALCRVSIAYTANSGNVTLTNFKKNGTTLTPSPTTPVMHSVEELINKLNLMTGERWAADGEGVFVMTANAYTNLNFGSLAFVTVCPEFQYCISREDDGDGTALTTAQTDYTAAGVITRKAYINGRSYYELQSNSATAPAAVGSDTIGANPCFEGPFESEA